MEEVRGASYERWWSAAKCRRSHLRTRSPLQQNGPLLSVLAVLGGAICLAQALVLVRRFPRVHPVTMNAVGMTAGAAVLLAASLVADEPIVLPHRPET
jgi:drug/metabolite transporter (DMT)-like permease